MKRFYLSALLSLSLLGSMSARAATCTIHFDDYTKYEILTYGEDGVYDYSATTYVTPDKNDFTIEAYVPSSEYAYWYVTVKRASDDDTDYRFKITDIQNADGTALASTSTSWTYDLSSVNVFPWNNQGGYVDGDVEFTVVGGTLQELRSDTFTLKIDGNPSAVKVTSMLSYPYECIWETEDTESGEYQVNYCVDWEAGNIRIDCDAIFYQFKINGEDANTQCYWYGYYYTSYFNNYSYQVAPGDTIYIDTDYPEGLAYILSFDLSGDNATWAGVILSIMDNTDSAEVLDADTDLSAITLEPGHTYTITADMASYGTTSDATVTMGENSETWWTSYGNSTYSFTATSDVSISMPDLYKYDELTVTIQGDNYDCVYIYNSSAAYGTILDLTEDGTVTITSKTPYITIAPQTGCVVTSCTVDGVEASYNEYAGCYTASVADGSVVEYSAYQVPREAYLDIQFADESYFGYGEDENGSYSRSVDIYVCDHASYITGSGSNYYSGWKLYGQYSGLITNYYSFEIDGKPVVHAYLYPAPEVMPVVKLNGEAIEPAIEESYGAYYADWVLTNVTGDDVLEFVTKSESTAINILEAVESNDAPVEYYNLQGQRVLYPAAGQLYIRRQGVKADKIIF
ncbi:MAG: hypothetical protein LIO90_00815 [Bacteroidales bacterium]|nr:hypothetical protein [Bacteroidales bacterium]